jgi:hypothetical protein
MVVAHSQILVIFGNDNHGSPGLDINLDVRHKKQRDDVSVMHKEIHI